MMTDSDSFEDSYTDVLKNLEAAIMSVYKQHRDLSDAGVDRAMEALTRYYKADSSGKTVTIRLADLDEQVFQVVKNVVEWRLGRGQPLPNVVKYEAHPDLKTVDEMIACLKRIRKSIRVWTKDGGRQGYLNYVLSFFSG